MRYIHLINLAAIFFFALPPIARAQEDSFTDAFNSGGLAGILRTEVQSVPAPPAPAGPFGFDPVINEKIAAKLNIPVFFALPASAFAQMGAQSGSIDGFWEFRHPASANAASPVGLRVYLTPRSNVAARLAANGLVQTGDILLTFRPEWGFEGPYTNIQMGVSHAGLALVENGIVSNIDNPLTQEYLGNLTGDHYKGTSALHIIRPRGLSPDQKANLLGWAGKLIKLAPKIYPSQLSFNQDYFTPKYTPDLKFVKTLAQIALRQDKTSGLDLYCSEFVWALLSLKDCDPAQTGVFAQRGVPACVKPVFAPMQMAGNYFYSSKAPGSRLGLSDGPLAVIDSMGLPEEEKSLRIHEVFDSKRRLSPGHASVEMKLKPYYMQLEGYYAGIQKGAPEAVRIMNGVNGNVKPNYSPASYLVNTLLPKDDEGRVLDVVATVLFTD